MIELLLSVRSVGQVSAVAGLAEEIGEWRQHGSGWLKEWDSGKGMLDRSWRHASAEESGSLSVVIIVGIYATVLALREQRLKQQKALRYAYRYQVAKPEQLS